MPDFPLTFSDLFRIARDEVLSRNPDLALDAVERDGSDANVLLAGACGAADEVVGQLVEVAAAAFLDSSEGAALDRLVFDRYSIARKSAAPALGSAEFRTSGPAAASFLIPSGTTLSTAEGKQFVTTQAVTLPERLPGPILAPMRSATAGADQQIKAGALTSIVGVIPGAPSGLVVSNSLATAGAADEESDNALRDRARRFWSTARRGTLAAIEQGALAVPGVLRATAIEVIDAIGRPAREVQLIIADQFTDVLVDLGQNPPTYQAQSQALALAVFQSLSDVRAAGIYVHVFVAQVVMQPINLSLHFQAGVNVDLVALTARAVLVSRVNSLAPGASLKVADLLEALRAVSGLDYQGDEIISPPGDVEPAALQVIRTGLNLVAALAVSDESGPLQVTANPDYYVVRG